MGSIITLRIIMIIATTIISDIGTYNTVRPCAQLAYISEGLARQYHDCTEYFDGSNPNAVAIVNANLNSPKPGEIGAALGISFGMAIWLSLAIHAIGVEVYVS
jgi:hypothetical protein